MKRTPLIIVLTIIALVFAPAAYAKRGGNGKPPKSTQTESVLQIHNRVCPLVVEYTNCNDVIVHLENLGATGYGGYSHPSTNEVTYNTYYTLSTAQWETMVAHEVGGHIDAWSEIVSKVGANNAWTDYYDIDTYAQQWLLGHGYNFSTGLSKELWLDCAGPVSHGYRGNYLTSYGVSTTVCSDHRDVMDKAIL